jgi:hypothetical protein
MKNIEKYKIELDSLIKLSTQLYISMQISCGNKSITLSEKEKEELPNFYSKYQTWYSQSKSVIKQLLPDRIDDFVRYYEKPKTRKELNSGNYTIEDYLQRLQVTHGDRVLVSQSAAISVFEQQMSILKSVESRFESSLFDISQLVQADLFDSEINSARELLKKGFIRASGAISGVILEKHLKQVINNHNLKLNKKTPTINDMNEILRTNEVIKMVDWRSIQRLGDIRNLCDHHKDDEPTIDNVKELINGVDKIIKTLY